MTIKIPRIIYDKNNIAMYLTLEYRPDSFIEVSRWRWKATYISLDLVKGTTLPTIFVLADTMKDLEKDVYKLIKSSGYTYEAY